MMRLVFLFVSGITFLSTSWAQTMLPNHETYQQITVAKKTAALRSRVNGDFRKNDTNRYLLHEYGTGSYGAFDNVTWHLESETALEENTLLPLYTNLTIRNSNSAIIFSSQQTYDHAKKTVSVTLHRDRNETKKSIFQLKGPTTDYASLVYFLRMFIPQLVSGEILHFYFISSEPGLYKLQARLLTQETIAIGKREIDTVKIALTPDAGALNFIIDRFVPPTLLWYANTDTYPWLQYEGLESGRGSSHIRTTIEEISPPL